MCTPTHTHTRHGLVNFCLGVKYHTCDANSTLLIFLFWISIYRILALECKQHLQANDVSEGECVSNEDRADLLSKISAGKKKVSELASEIHDVTAELEADLRIGIKEDDDTVANSMLGYLRSSEP